MLSLKEGSDSVPTPLSLGRVRHNGHSGIRSWLLEVRSMDILSIRGFTFRGRLIQHCTRESSPRKTAEQHRMEDEDMMGTVV